MRSRIAGACQSRILRYLVPMRVVQSGAETIGADFELPSACRACGGSLAIRLTTSGARGCCLRCRVLCALEIAEEDGEVKLAQAAGPSA